MVRTAWPVAELPTRTVTHRPRTETSAYSDQVRAQSYDLIVSGDLSCAGATGSHSHLPCTNPRLDIVHTYDCPQLSHLLSTPHHDESRDPLQLEHPSYSLLPAGHEPINNAPTGCGNPGFSQSSELYSPWGLYYHYLGSLPDASYVPLPTFHDSTLDPVPYFDSPYRQFPWSTEDAQVGFAHEVPPTPTVYDIPGFPLPNSSPSPHSNLDVTSEPCSETLEASYPCQWMKGDVTCNVMVQATRSHMNRHLHVYHGFGGSDARQTRCYWTGCGATMQQGSVARHMVTCHLQAKVTCPMCFKKLSRQDVISKHQRVCPAAGTWC